MMGQRVSHGAGFFLLRETVSTLKMQRLAERRLFEKMSRQVIENDGDFLGDSRLNQAKKYV